MNQSSVVRELPSRIQVRAWADPWREANGFAPRSAYVEFVWAGTLGPTATAMYRRLGSLVNARPDGATIDVADLGAGLGVGRADGRWSLLARAVGRLVCFGVARWDGDSLEIRRALPAVPSHVLSRLGATAQRVHAAELARVARIEGPATDLGAGRSLHRASSVPALPNGPAVVESLHL